MPITSGGTGGNINLPSGWQSQPTTQQSFEATVTLIEGEYGTEEADAFETWYQAAWKKDPSLTPDEAVTIWVTQETLSGGISQTGNLLGQIPGAAAEGAEKAVKSLELSNPLAAIAEFIGDIGSWISNRTNIVRVIKVVVGGSMVLVGLNMLTKDTTNIDIGGAVTGAAKAAIK
jgi:hypothetical protein